MGELYEELWVEILGRLPSEKDVVICMRVSKSWHRISSDVWVRRFWAQSPPLGLYFRTIQSALGPHLRKPMDKEPSYLPRMNYISLYNYHVMEDNQESTRTLVSKRGRFRTSKIEWQLHRLYRRDEYDDDDDDEYLDCCNGLLLLLNMETYQFYVCNPITTQQIPVPNACVHKNDERKFCAALAFDPSESPHHYRVVRIDYSESTSHSALLDIFSSEYGQWVRHRLQLDPGFTEGFEKFKFCKQFVYLRGKLYSMSMSWKLLCIDLRTVEACTLELPVPEASKTGTKGCLGVSMDLLCYIKRMHDSFDDLLYLVVWYYDDRSSEWTLTYSVSCILLGRAIKYRGCKYDDTDVEPYAISPSSDVLFFGTPDLICCYHLKSEKIKFVYHRRRCKIDAPGDFWILRACFVPFYQLGNRNSGSTDLLATVSDSIEILTAEALCEEKKDDEFVEMISINLCDRYKVSLPLMIYPSEINEMYLEFNHHETSNFDAEASSSDAEASSSDADASSSDAEASSSDSETSSSDSETSSSDSETSSSNSETSNSDSKASSSDSKTSSSDE